MGGMPIKVHKTDDILKGEINMNKCSMQKKIESISNVLPKHDWLDSSMLENEITELLDGRGEEIINAIEKNGDDPMYYRFAVDMVSDSGYYGDLCDSIQDSMFKYVRNDDYAIPGNFERINWSWDEDHKGGIKFSELRKKLLAGIDDADTQEFSTWGIDWFFKAFGTHGLCYNYENLLDDIAADYEREDADESKKSEAKDNEIPYVMMQCYYPDTKTWEPILVEINSNSEGWFYDGLATVDNFGNFAYDEFGWDFIHQRCRKGTDKCDPELVQSMERYYLNDFNPNDEYQPRKVDRLRNHVPKGARYIGKN